MADTGARRARNKRGQGARLREDIIDAATALLEETGEEDAVTLRAVARAAGITAPAIYAHFATPHEVKLAVIERAFAALASALRPAAEGHEQSAAALDAVCQAYLGFAEDHPHLYRVLFQRSRRQPVEPGSTGADVTTIVGADAYGILLGAVRACVSSGDSTERDPQAAALRVWVSLHGMATLRASMPHFPWPPRDQLLDQLLARAADLKAGSSPT